MKNKKGFTLIELLAVIIILGVLMIIAIPSVTKYIDDSRKNGYVSTAKELAGGARNLVYSGSLSLDDFDTTYYIDAKCISTDNAYKSPYGDFVKAYVVVTASNDNYEYFWTSVDDAGRGVKGLVNVNKLDSNNIETDISSTDITTNRGIDNRGKIVIIDDKCEKGPSEIRTGPRIDSSTGEEPEIICKRATTLHTAICDYSGRGYDGCWSITSVGGSFTYGNLGTRGTLTSGDAFDCDVNGDGVFNSTNERFYYVSDYYDTINNKFDNNYAALIYYSGVSDGVQTSSIKRPYATYGDCRALDSSLVAPYCSWMGPVTANKHLPSTSQWSNVRLKTSTRAILAEEGDNHHILNTNYMNYQHQTAYNYGNSAARLLNAYEYFAGCNVSSIGCSGGYNNEQNASCIFLGEDTQFSSLNNTAEGLWIETPTQYAGSVFLIYTSGYPVATCRNPDQTYFLVKPVIDVPKINIEI